MGIPQINGPISCFAESQNGQTMVLFIRKGQDPENSADTLHPEIHGEVSPCGNTAGDQNGTSSVCLKIGLSPESSASSSVSQEKWHMDG